MSDSLAALLDGVSFYGQSIRMAWDEDGELIAIVSVNAGVSPDGVRRAAAFEFAGSGADDATASETLGRALVAAATWLKSCGRDVETDDDEPDTGAPP